MSQNSQTSSYPLRIDETTRSKIDEAIKKINENLKSAKSRWSSIRNNIGRSTGTVITNGPDYIHFSTESIIFFPFSTDNQNILESVLVVSEKFGWRPENILALWQAEGLHSSIKYEKKNLL
jgi:hypothetical protein